MKNWKRWNSWYVLRSDLLPIYGWKYGKHGVFQHITISWFLFNSDGLFHSALIIKIVTNMIIWLDYYEMNASIFFSSYFFSFLVFLAFKAVEWIDKWVQIVCKETHWNQNWTGVPPMKRTSKSIEPSKFCHICV